MANNVASHSTNSILANLPNCFAFPLPLHPTRKYSLECVCLIILIQKFFCSEPTTVVERVNSRATQVRTVCTSHIAYHYHNHSQSTAFLANEKTDLAICSQPINCIMLGRRLAPEKLGQLSRDFLNQ